MHVWGQGSVIHYSLSRRERCFAYKFIDYLQIWTATNVEAVSYKLNIEIMIWFPFDFIFWQLGTVSSILLHHKVETFVIHALWFITLAVKAVIVFTLLTSKAYLHVIYLCSFTARKQDITRKIWSLFEHFEKVHLVIYYASYNSDKRYIKINTTWTREVLRIWSTYL